MGDDPLVIVPVNSDMRFEGGGVFVVCCTVYSGFSLVGVLFIKVVRQTGYLQYTASSSSCGARKVSEKDGNVEFLKVSQHLRASTFTRVVCFIDP